jgi:hypothetical protein
VSGRAVKPGADKGTNQVISFWHEGHNLGVLSSCDAKFIEEMRRWAKKNGYRVEPIEAEES